MAAAGGAMFAAGLGGARCLRWEYSVPAVANRYVGTDEF
jgi:hypothetical protein